MAKEFETKNDDTAICPHCEHVLTDVWELLGDKGDCEQILIDCPECEKEFTIRKDIDITYTSFIEEV